MAEGEASAALSHSGFRHRRPPVEVLTEEALATLERGWLRLLRDVGVRFDDAGAQRRFREAGQDVDADGVVRIDPDWLAETLARAPSTFTLRARNPARSVQVGGDALVLANVAGPPFVLERGVRRDGTLRDLERFLMLAHVADEVDSHGSIPCEPSDRPLDSRHLDVQLAALTLSDKPHQGTLFSGAKARDGLDLAAIAFGGADVLEREHVVHGIANANSPLVFDEAMIGVIEAYAERNQPVIVTPFLLMGAMSPVSVPAALVQQTAEALAGAALVQLVRPGAPVVLGSFLSHTDMRTGAPGFGGPESAVGLLASGQIARRIGLPWRAGGGGLTSSPRPDAQAAAESLTTLHAMFASGANVALHAIGWLESGLVASLAKAVLDLDLLRALRAEFAPLEVDEASLAFDAHVEVGHGGHFLGAAHTLERFRDCFHRPLVATTASFERWSRDGARDAAERAEDIAEELLARYEPPPMADGIREALEEHVARRRRELGD